MKCAKGVIAEVGGDVESTTGLFWELVSSTLGREGSTGGGRGPILACSVLCMDGLRGGRRDEEQTVVVMDGDLGVTGAEELGNLGSNCVSGALQSGKGRAIRLEVQAVYE